MIKLNEISEKMTPSLTLAINAKAAALKSQGRDVVAFGAGEPDFDTPDFIKEAAIEAIKNGVTKYTPVAGTVDLKEAVCEKLKRDNHLDYKPSQIVVSNGAKHSLYNIFRVLLNKGDEVIIPSPFWLSYPEMVTFSGGESVFVETKDTDFKMTPAAFEAAITPRTKAVVINSPSNPNGAVYSSEELAAIAEVALKHNVVIISDEIYEELIYDNTVHTSIAQISEEVKENTIIVNGMSKAFAMTGWRIGYAAAPEHVAKAMTSFQSHAASNPNSIAQYASAVALRREKTFMDEMRGEFEARRNLIVELINGIDGLSCNKPGGAFYVMMNISALIGRSYEGKEITGSLSFADILLDGANVAVVPGAAFGCDEFVRLSYATSQENIKKGLERIADFVSRLD
ncbi:MAG: pyridoxal phosphate-dependent aminotransferase [Clostridia bacterium]|nr:pyridoxal phosphate-dependent aminotransferase [Clostridia bacterium]